MAQLAVPSSESPICQLVLLHGDELTVDKQREDQWRRDGWNRCRIVIGQKYTVNFARVESVEGSAKSANHSGPSLGLTMVIACQRFRPSNNNFADCITIIKAEAYLISIWFFLDLAWAIGQSELIMSVVEPV